MVDGVGFNTYIDLLKVLEIDFVIRTDNDVFKVPRSEPVKYRLAGIQRGLGFFLRMNGIDPDRPVATPVPPPAAATRAAAPAEPMDEFIDKREKLTGHPENLLAAMSEGTRKLAARYRMFLAGERVFIAKEDLEKDLLASPAGAAINDYLVEGEGKDDVDSLKIMQKRKATFMYNFLQRSEAALGQLAEDEIAAPLHLCLQIAKERRLIEEDETDE
jgi:putative ATP-dependent endonuclease of OLD family